MRNEFMPGVKAILLFATALMLVACGIDITVDPGVDGQPDPESSTPVDPFLPPPRVDPQIAKPCETTACLTPLTEKPAIITILLALGDQVDNELVGNNVSNQFIVESVIRYSSPLENPRILIVEAYDNGGEDPEDTLYVKNLLSRYDVVLIKEPESGLDMTDVADFDVVWFNNPGHPFSKAKSLATLLGFAGAVVLQGDDLARGTGFSLSELTGLEYVDNGTRVICEGVSYSHDNNGGEHYHVQLDDSKIQGLDQATITFRYGNDIDKANVIGDNVEVLATAKGGPDTCTELRPVITRKLK